MGKEYIAIAVSFYSQFFDKLEKPIAEEIELYKFLGIVSKKELVDEKGIIKYTDIIYNKFNKITNGEDIECNGLALALGGLAMLLEIDYFKGSQKMKANRLFWFFYNEVENYKNKGFRNANKLISQFVDLKE